MRLLVRRISFRTWPFLGVCDLGAPGAAGHRRPHHAPVLLSLLCREPEGRHNTPDHARVPSFETVGGLACRASRARSAAMDAWTFTSAMPYSDRRMQPISLLTGEDLHARRAMELAEVAERCRRN